MICECSLAGTVACKTCRNNPDADPSAYKSYITTTYTTELGINVSQLKERLDKLEHEAKALRKMINDSDYGRGIYS